jgi:hypothetical protein
MLPGMAERFKLDLLSIAAEMRAANDTADGWTGLALVCIGNLSRQLHAAGAPGAPFEEQARTLLASHRALAAAGEEVPSRSKISELLQRERTIGDMTAAILDLLRPIFARRTRERDEAIERADYAERGRATWESASRGWQADFEAERKTINALRQRAERAEQEVEAARRRDVQREVEIAGTRRLRDDANVAAANLRTRVADLEALLTSACRTRAHVALLDWLAVASGTRDGDDERIVGAMAALAAPSAHVEPGAGMVERLARDAGKAIYPRLAWADLTEGARDMLTKTAHVVLSALAAMGDEAWPSEDDVALALIANGGQEHPNAAARIALYVCRSRLSPVIGALRAELAAARADGMRVAEEAREAARVALGERRELQVATVADEPSLVGPHGCIRALCERCIKAAIARVEDGDE